MVWSLLSLWLIQGMESKQWKQLPQNTITGAPSPAWHITASLQWPISFLAKAMLPPCETAWECSQTIPHRNLESSCGLSHATWRKPVGSYLAWSYLHHQGQGQRRLSTSTNAEISWDISPALCLWAAVPRRDLMVWKKNLLPIVTGLKSLDHHQNRKQKT